MKYKLIAADLDGTLLDDNSMLTERTRLALKRAMELGAVFVPATGRPAAAVPDFIRSLPGLRYVISSNGARVYDLVLDRVIHQVTISPDKLLLIMDRLREHKAWMELSIDGTSYVDEEYYNNIDRYICRKHSIEYLKATRVPVPSVAELMFRFPDRLEKLCFFYMDSAAKTSAQKALGTLEGVYVADAFETMMEFSDLNANKGDALYYIADLLGIDHEDTLAFGDGMNDSIMLEYAGLGVAMANSFPGVSDSADMIAPSNSEDGVAFVLEQLMK